MRRAGWTLVEVMVAGSLLLLLLSLSSLALASYGRTLRGLQHEGDQMAQASHALERLQGLLAQSLPLAPGLYDLKEKPLSLTLLSGDKLQVDLAGGLVHWKGRVQGPARELLITSRRREGHQQLEILWRMPEKLPDLMSVFDATTRP